MLVYEQWSDLFEYSETSQSGLLWRVDILTGKGGVRKSKGTVAGSPNKSGRWSVQVNRKLYQCHRVIWEMFNGSCGRLHIDHIDGDPLNNKIENLRLTTHAANMRNCKSRKDNKSGYKGVYIRRRGKYISVVAAWYFENKKFAKEFSANEDNLSIVLEKVNSFRITKLEELNNILLDDGYTKRHIGRTL